MADWSYSCNDVDCAIEHAHKASELAQEGGLPLEIEAAKKRAIIFSPIKTSSSVYIIVLIWLLIYIFIISSSLHFHGMKEKEGIIFPK